MKAPFTKPSGDELRQRIGKFAGRSTSQIPHHVPDTLSLVLKDDGWELWGGEDQREPLPITVETAYLFAVAAGIDAQRVLDKTRTHLGSLRIKLKSRRINGRYEKELVSAHSQLSQELEKARAHKPKPEWAQGRNRG